MVYDTDASPLGSGAGLYSEYVEVGSRVGAHVCNDARMVLDDIARVEVGAVWNVYRV